MVALPEAGVGQEAAVLQGLPNFLLMQDIVELNRQDRLRRRNDNVFMHTLSDEEFLRQFRFT